MFWKILIIRLTVLQCHQPELSEGPSGVGGGVGGIFVWFSEFSHRTFLDKIKFHL